MKKEEFIEILNDKGYSFRIEGETIVIDNEGTVLLHELTSLPKNVQFNNNGHVYLKSLTSLPKNVKFSNQGNIYLNTELNKSDNHAD